MAPRCPLRPPHLAKNPPRLSQRPPIIPASVSRFGPIRSCPTADECKPLHLQCQDQHTPLLVRQTAQIRRLHHPSHPSHVKPHHARHRTLQIDEVMSSYHYSFVGMFMGHTKSKTTEKSA